MSENIKPKVAEATIKGLDKVPDYGIGWRHSEKERDVENGSEDVYVDQAPDILVCQIKIWDPDKHGIQPAPGKADCAMVLNEVERLTVTNSYKNVINTASVIIPKGSIIKKVITTASANLNTESQDEWLATDAQGSLPKPTVKDDKSSDSNVVDGTPVFDKDGVSKMGVVLTTSTEHGSAAEPSMFKTGYRIEIRTGYTQDPIVAEKISEYENHKCLNLVFSGFITGVSPTTPIELKCEDLAYILRGVACKNVVSKGDKKVSEFLYPKDKGGVYDLLEGTNIELHPDVFKTDISIGSVELSDNINVADMLNEWSKSGLMCFMRLCSDGIYRLSVGRTYISTQSTDQSDSLMYHPDEDTIVIYSDWDVADDDLSIMEVDKNFIIIDAEGWKAEDGRNYHCKISVRLNPESKEGDPDDERFQFINQKDWTSTRSSKRKKGSRTIKDKVSNLKAYSRYPYISKTWGISLEDLKKEAISYFKNFNPSGVSGKLTLFGGRDIRPTSIIAFMDMRQPARQGLYLVDEVVTTFGVNGYRQEITIPYRIKLFDDVKIQN